LDLASRTLEAKYATEKKKHKNVLQDNENN